MNLLFLEIVSDLCTCSHQILTSADLPLVSSVYQAWLSLWPKARLPCSNLSFHFLLHFSSLLLNLSSGNLCSCHFFFQLYQPHVGLWASVSIIARVLSVGILEASPAPLLYTCEALWCLSYRDPELLPGRPDLWLICFLTLFFPCWTVSLVVNFNIKWKRAIRDME